MRALSLSFIRFYQRRVSGTLSGGCRFQPTCSCYGYEAIDRHGAVRGWLLTFWRLARCNPFNSGGYDPVP